MIIFEKVKKIYKTNNQIINVFENLDFTIESGDFIKIVGPNGSGKSTFLKLIKKIILPNQGNIYFNDDINQSDIAYVSQNLRSFFLNLTVKQNLLFFNSLINKGKINFESKILENLKYFNLEEKINTQMSNLSSGQVKKISIIRALLSNPKVLLLDEVTSNLEEKSRSFLSDFVQNELNKAQNISIIWTTHYPNEIKQNNEKSYSIENNMFKKFS